MPTSRRPRQRIPLYLQTLLAIVLAVAAGLMLGPRIAGIGAIGGAIIRLVKILAAPLLFFAVLDAVSTAQFKGRGVYRMLALYAVNGLAALTIGLVLVNAFEPGKTLDVSRLSAGDPQAEKYREVARKFGQDGGSAFLKGVLDVVPESIVAPFAQGSILGVIFLAIILGLGLRALKKGERQSAAAIDGTVRALYGLFLHGLTLVIHAIPLAVFAVVAEAIAVHGFSMFRGLAAYLIVALLGLGLQILLVYVPWITLVSRVGLRRYWREGKEAVLHAIGVNSSLATLPLTLRALDRMGVRPGSARLAACVGTNLNNDGILLYEALAALFLAQAYGIDLSLLQQLSLAGVCVIATLGIGGVPEAGFISLALVLGAVGLPLEALPLLLSVDWIIARARSAVNVLSDMTGAVVLDRFETK